MERKIFVLNKGGHRYNNDEKGFKQMRRRLFMEFTDLYRHNMGAVADFFDDVREMKIGSEVYVTDSKSVMYTAFTLKRFNERLNTWWNYAKREGLESIQPSFFHMYVIRKTDKCFTVKELDYELI